jgi:hypothetical protein
MNGKMRVVGWVVCKMCEDTNVRAMCCAKIATRAVTVLSKIEMRGKIKSLTNRPTLLSKVENGGKGYILCILKLIPP